MVIALKSAFLFSLCSVLMVSPIYMNMRDTYENCSKLNHFAKGLSEFTYCSLVYTVPFNLCRKCLSQYQSLRTVYQSLVDPSTSLANSTFRESDGNVCPEDIVSRDKLANIQTYYAQSKSIWLTANCDNCYDMYSDQSNLDDFFDLVISLDSCITVTELNVTCTECQGNYTELNRYFMRLKSQYGNNLCYDIIDTMSLVRDNWDSGMGCNVDHSFDMPTMAIALIMLTLMPLVFYAFGLCYCREKGPALVQQKRLSSINLLNERTKIMEPVVQFP